MDNLIRWFVVLWLVISLIELIVMLNWPYWYAAFGIPVFWSSKSYPTRDGGLVSAESLKSDGNLSNPASFAPINFHSLSDGSIAFCSQLSLDRLFVRPYISVMRGVIRLSPNGNSVRIIGFLNYRYVFLIVGLLGGVISLVRGDLVLAPAIAVAVPAILMVYQIQVTQYRRILELAAPRA